MPQARLADARSLLFVPGNRPERFAKAAARHVITANWRELTPLDVLMILRINAEDSAAWPGCR